MRTIQTEIHIAAAPATVWHALLDFPTHAEWNPLFDRIEGPVELGARLAVGFKGGMTMRPRIVELAPERVLEWHGKLGFGGLFDGRHRFELVPHEGGTLLRHSERFTGLLVPLFGKVLRDTAAKFVAFNEALARRCTAAEAPAWDARPA